ncbi:MAG: hypothetical protein WBA74_27660 [Cyclobacteriaceae bacterium]
MKSITLLLCFQIGFLINLSGQNLFDAYQFRTVGPERGGRVTAVAGTVKQPGTFYLGATGGGVWKTTDYGTSWKNVSDGFFATPSIGAISVSQMNPETVYVGTGSDGLRSNVIKGKGVYASKDGGKTWRFLGLENTGQIGALKIHPENDDVLYVAAIGQAFNNNVDRGIYKSLDGGESWKKVKYISDATGFADIEIFTDQPEELIAAAWEAQRKPWTINSGGKEGGIFKSKDGGETWYQVQKGLPEGLIGKVDISISGANKAVVYALVEAEEGERGLYKSEDRGESFKLVSEKKGLTTRPFYYTNVKADPGNPNKVYVLATSYYQSVDGGNTWENMRSPHGDNHDMWINPDNPDLFIQANDGGANVTFNGGKTWSTQFNQPTAEIYQVEVDDQYPYWLYGGQQDNYSTIAVPSMPPYGVQSPDRAWIINTGGCETGPAVPKPGNADIVYANCKGKFSVYHKPTGTEKRYDVGAANMYGHNPKELKHRFQRVSPIHVSPHDPDVVYHASQFVHKTTDDGMTWETISPDLTAFEADKQVISGAPLTRDITGEEFYSTIYSIRESPVKAGVIWTGANDGPVYVTKDGGANWQNVTPETLPKGGRVDAVEPSPFNPAVAYFSVLRYQLGDWQPYIYKTDDYGENWEKITEGIPSDFPVRVVREDPQTQGLLYAGTEYGLFISFDDGKSWQSFQQNLPVTPITDIKLHRGDLVLSTMGRGFWILDNVTSLRGLKKNRSSQTGLLPLKETVRYRSPKGRGSGTAHVKYPRPGLIIDYQLENSSEEPIRLDIIDSEGTIVTTIISQSDDEDTEEKIIEDMSLSQTFYVGDPSLTTEKGINRYKWNFRRNGTTSDKNREASSNGPLIIPGEYTVRLIAGEKTFEESVSIKPDPRIIESGVTIEDMKAQQELALKVVQLMEKANELQENLKNAREKYSSKKKLSTENKQTEAIYNQLVTKKGTYQKPMLRDQISYLYYILTAADQRPGKDVYERFLILQKQLDDLIEKNKQLR